MNAASVVRWLDSHHGSQQPVERPLRIDLVRLIPFIAVHLACLAVPLVGASPLAVGLAAALYLVRMFGITAGYHRHFAHRAFAAPRWFSVVLALLGASAGQRGPLWWAAHHRHHHRHSDQPEDLHSPVRHGFWWSHLGWFLADGAYRSRLELVPDLARRPELVWLDRFDSVCPALLAGACFALGWWLEGRGWDTSGAQLLVWFCISTVLVAHVTFSVNSVMHVWGTRPFATSDTSRNNALIALLTLGEGWHNNHHRHPGNARQGLRWWEVDLAWYALLGLAGLGLVRGMRNAAR